MIKNLYLVRHGKAVSDSFHSSDIDRPLKEKGIQETYAMAERMLSKNQIPDLIVSSIAARALHTATIFSRVFELSSSKILIKDNLYLADLFSILDVICKTNDDINSLLLVGHNPGLTDISNFFTGGDIDNIPTSGIVGLTFDINYWPDLLNIRPTESFFDYPKNII